MTLLSTLCVTPTQAPCATSGRRAKPHAGLRPHFLKKDRGTTHRLYSVRPTPPPSALVRARLHALQDVRAVTSDAGGQVVGIGTSTLRHPIGANSTNSITFSRGHWARVSEK